MKRRPESNDHLERYLEWRVEAWRTDRARFLKRFAGALAAGAGASLLGAGRAFGSQSREEANPAKGQTLDVFLANHTPFYAMIGKEFEKRYGAKLNFTREQFGLIPSKLTPAFESGGHSWDVAYMWRAWVEQYRKFLTPLDEISGFRLPPSQKADMLPVAYKQIKALDGKIYGLPSNVYTYVLYGNKKRLDKAGIKLPRTYGDFVEACKELTGRGLLGYTDGWAPLYLFPKWCVWLHLNGGELFKGEAGKVRFDSPEAMQATQDMIDLLPYMPKESITSPWGIYDVEAKKVFFSGKAAMIIDYQHIWYEAQNPAISKVGPGNVAVGLIPGSKKIPGSNKVGPKSGGQFVGECFVIPKTSTKKEAALQLIRFFSNATQQTGLLTRRAELQRFDPAGEDGYPAYKSSYRSRRIKAKDRPIVNTTFAQQRYPGKRYETRPAYQAIADAIEAAVSAALNKQKDVEAAHKAAQKAIDEIVAAERLP
jgi:ABC-type glycerol-3-phosphate transport system substrate-binding protein